jgi:hypothetical protein
MSMTQEVILSTNAYIFKYLDISMIQWFLNSCESWNTVSGKFMMTKDLTRVRINF